MTLSHNYACKRLSALGVRQQHVHAIIDAVSRWTKASGPEWTVSRLKTLKTHFLHRLAGDGKSTLDWVASRAGIPKGPFRRLFLDINSSRKRVRALNALMVYTGYVSTEVTPKQWRKFSGSVEQLVTISEEERRETSLFQSWLANQENRRGLNLKALTIRPNDWTKWADVPWESRGTRVPLFTNNKVRSVSISEINQWYPASKANPWVRYFFALHRDLAQNIEWMDPLRFADWANGEPSGGFVGKVSFIQEPGFKLRAVANPDPLVQLALEPLKQGLLGLLKGNVRDCTHNQDSGVEAVKGWLSEGKVVHSIDLSDATNNFPLTLQQMILDVVCPITPDVPYDIRQVGLNRGFIAAAKGPWFVHDPLTKSSAVMRWSRGQPLGLGPSFPLFAVTHHALVQYAMSGLSHDDRSRSDYRILGDDIVITGAALATRYRELLGAFQCPVSEEKCLVSDKVAEFAGKVILRDEILNTFKWRQVSDRNFLDVCKQLGPSGLSLLRPQQRQVANVLLSIPEWYGGLGFNPKGLTLETRTALAVELGLLEDSANRRIYTEAASLRIRNLINSGECAPRPALPHELVHPITGEDLQVLKVSEKPRRTSLVTLLADRAKRLDRPGQVNLQVPISTDLGMTRVKLEEQEARNSGFLPTGRTGGDPRGPTQLDKYRYLIPAPAERLDVGKLPVTDDRDDVGSSSPTPEP